jgi:endonuclease-8
MPEGHTIHKLARDLARDLAGSRVEAISPQGRFSEGAARIDGKLLKATDAWGKHLFLEFPRTRVHIHLGLFGRFRRRRQPVSAPRDTTRLRLTGSKWTWDLSGPTCCEVLTAAGRKELLTRLGDDPLRAECDGSRFIEAAAASRRAIGAMLLDQRVIAGVGNVYRAELLFLAGIRPDRPGRSIAEEELAALWSETVAQLERGVKLGRIVTTPGEKPKRGERLWVYKRGTCRRCKQEIVRTQSANRWIWFCPKCQS